MKILLLGSNGQLGWELQRALASIGQLVAYSRQECNIEDIETLRKLIEQVSPNIVVNATAYTAVDKAENDVDKAYLVNAEAVKVMAEACEQGGAWLIHYSTDYVFDGLKKSPYAESDIPNPLNIYGQSKLMGEEYIRKICSKHIIFRTSWVFSTRGRNFLKSILNKASEVDTLQIIDNQYGNPTSAELLADVTANVLNKLAVRNGDSTFSGLYHLCCDGYTSWYAYAHYLLHRSQELGIIRILPSLIPVTWQEYASVTQRPENSRLDNSKIKNVFSLTLPHWTFFLDRTLQEISNKG